MICLLILFRRFCYLLVSGTLEIKKNKTMSAFTSLINGSVLGELTETKGLNEE